MKSWEEEDVIEKLRNRGPEDECCHQWLLILVQKVNLTDHDFMFYMGNSDDYDRFAEFLVKIPVKNGNASDISRDDIPEDTVWVETVDHEDSFEEEEEEEVKEEEMSSPRFQPHYVAKALFNTSSTNHEALLEAGPASWRIAVEQKYQLIRFRSQGKEETDADGDSTKEADKKHNETKVAAAAAAAFGSGLGGGAAVVGTNAAAAGMGYTATGIAANSWGAAIMASEAVASGGGVAAGGFTATMQSIGAAGVMASPIGMGVLAAGAVIGGGSLAYLAVRGMNKNKKDVKKDDEEIRIVEQNIEYKKLKTDEVETKEESKTYPWVVIIVQKQECEGHSEYSFMHRSFEDVKDAEAHFVTISSNFVAKGLINPQGLVIKSGVDDTDVDGWDTAMTLNYDLIVAQGLIVATTEPGTDAFEATPLLENEV